MPEKAPIAPPRIDGSSHAGARVRALTVLIPTRNERENVPRLLERLEAVCLALPLEILFVDDSSDDTAGVIREECRRYSRPVRVIHRPESERAGGLGGAVKAGLSAAQSEWVCVMDADLQHPPEVVTSLVDEAECSGADVVVASRYCAGGDVGKFSSFRVALSQGSTRVARGLFPRRLRGVSDPMSGFFLVRRAAVEVSGLRPRGFKILLDILLSGRPLATREVAYRFGERHGGKSKASFREVSRYVRRLIELRLTGRGVRLAGFGGVGGVGILVNTAALRVCSTDLHLFYLVGSVLATQVAILSNFLLAECLVFRGADRARTFRFRITSYAIVSNCSLALTSPLLVLLVSVLGMRLLLANVVALTVLVGARFVICDAYVWGSTPWPATGRSIFGRSRESLATALMIDRPEP